MKHIGIAASKTIVCCVTLFLALLPVHAAEHEVVFEAHPVSQVFQEPNESWDEFVSRSGRVMRDYTDTTGFEAGGWLCVHRTTGQGAMTVISSHSQISVSASIKGCPLQGYALTPEFMHSHPVKEHIVLTAHDLHGHPASKVARLFSGMRAGSRVRVGASGGRFSKADLGIGPGYLVHGDNLYYQKDGHQSLARSLRAIQETPTAQRFIAQLASERHVTTGGTLVETRL